MRFSISITWTRGMKSTSAKEPPYRVCSAGGLWPFVRCVDFERFAFVAAQRVTASSNRTRTLRMCHTNNPAPAAAAASTSSVASIILSRKNHTNTSPISGRNLTRASQSQVRFVNRTHALNPSLSHSFVQPS